MHPLRLYHFLKGIKDNNNHEVAFVGLLDNQEYIFDSQSVKNSRLPSGTFRFDDPPKRRTKPEHFEDEIWKFLNFVSGDVEKLLKNNIANPPILFNDENYEHNTDGGFIGVIGTDTRNFTLNTGNLVGFVKRGNYSLKISSRFGDSFLCYMIANTDGFLEKENIGSKSYGDGYEWLLAYLWNIKLKKAYRQGLPKAYITQNDRISRIRGTIDAVDYFRNNTSGKYLCSYREHSYDSPATSLFIKAYEAIEHYSFCRQTRNIYNTFLTATQGVKRTHQEILRAPHFTNPFYNDYNVLIDLSKQVIHMRNANFDSQHDSNAFFFDISMLFEYFIRKLIERKGIHLLSKSERLYEIPSAGEYHNRKRKLKPDLVFEREGNLYVFDVKYKTFNRQNGVKREDLFQLHTYIGQYGNEAPIKGCGFVYPITEEKWAALELDKTQGLIEDVICQQSKKIPFFVTFLKIPTTPKNEERMCSETFKDQMSKACSEFLNTLCNCILN